MQMDRLSATAEEACFNAWPALKEIFYDGWLIRLANGETRRTNSVNVIGPGSRAMEEKIAHCERIYAAHNQSAYFRIRSCDDPVLEDVLEQRGLALRTDRCCVDVDHPSGHVGAFDIGAQPDEPVRFAAAHRARRDAGRQLTLGDDTIQEPTP